MSISLVDIFVHSSSSFCESKEKLPGLTLSLPRTLGEMCCASLEAHPAGDSLRLHWSGSSELSPIEIRWSFWKVWIKVVGLYGVNCSTNKSSITVEIAKDAKGDDSVKNIASSLLLDLQTAGYGASSALDCELHDELTQTLKEAELGYQNWVNQDPSIRTSIAIAKDVESLNKHDTVTTHIYAEDELEKMGANLLLAVGKGSRVSPPRLVVAHYTPKTLKEIKADTPRRVLVGKGITFDTGGINVKPYESFVSMMKNDMAGSALAFHLFESAVKSDYNAPLSLVIATCENAIGEECMRPGAIVTGMAKISVRIDHTDAEGRLVLADALAYVAQKMNAKEVWTFATLTTSALNSYGPYATPVHFADKSLQSSIETLGQRLGEDFHFFQKRVWHDEANLDKEAELRNTARLPGNASKGAGSRNAAHFLRAFCPKDTPLVHFDIFASTWNWAGDYPGATSGATGAAIRTLGTYLCGS